VIHPPEEYRRRYYDDRPPLPENFLPKHPFMNAPQATSGRDESPLSVKDPQPIEPIYDNSKRTPDRWQPKWIRDKYFGGSESRTRGTK
jgi:hypothetical protein